MESHLLKGALVSYGQELLNALKEEQGLDQVGYALQGLSRNDLQQAHPRPRDPILQDPVKRSKFIRFVARKADILYKTWDTLPHTLTTDEENEELCAVMPPVESFMSVPAAERKKYFFETLKKGDIAVGHISGKQENGFFVTLQCLDGGLRREIHDLSIKAFCPLNQIQTFSAHESPFDVFQSKDLVRGVVISCSSESERIILSMKSDALPADQQHLMKLGLITEEDIPSHHKRLLATHGRSFQEVLERTMGFNNPATATHLCSVLGIPSWKQASLMKGMQMKEYPREEYAVALRKAQSSKWAYKSLKDGVMHFKAGNHTEAFVCLNKALQIDPENVEALVARGALFANNSNLRRALEDFEAALALNPSHPNARKYMSETLVALGRYYEEKNDLEGAVKTYKKAVKVNLSNADARDALMAVEVRDRKKDSDTRSLSSQTSALADLQPGTSKPKDTREKLRMLLREDEKKKHKRHHHSRRSSSSSSASSSSSSGSSRSSSSSGYGRHRSRKHRSRKHRKGDADGGEKQHGSKKKKSKESRRRSSDNGAPEPEVVPAQTVDEEDSYWKMAGETRTTATGQGSTVQQQPSATSSSSRQARRSMSPLSRALAQRLYEAEEELGVHKSAFARQEDATAKTAPSPKTAFASRSSEQHQQASRLFHVSGSDVASSSASYDKKEGSDGLRMESVVRRPEVAPPTERKSIEFKWKAVKKPLQQADADSHEEGSVTTDDEKQEPEKKDDKQGVDDKDVSSHEEGSIHSESDRDKDRRKRRDYSSSRSSSRERKDRPLEKHRRKIRRRVDSESESSSAHSKSPRRRRRRSGDRSEDYSSDRSSMSRGRRRHGRSSDSSRSRRRYSSDDSRDGKGGSRRRDDSYSSDSSHRRHSPSRRGRGGYRPYYHQNRGGYYNNRRYNNYRGGYQNNRYFRGGRGGRRPYRPYYNRGSPRYYNSGYSNRSSHGRDRRSGSEGHDDRGGSFCPPWKRKNPIVSRAPDAEELKKLKEAAAQRHQEKEDAGSSKITKATIIRNWLDDADSRSPPRGSVSPKVSRVAEVASVAPLQPPLPPVSSRMQQPPPPGE